MKTLRATSPYETLDVVGETTLIWTVDTLHDNFDDILFFDTIELKQLLGINKPELVHITEVPFGGGIRYHIDTNEWYITWFMLEFLARGTLLRWLIDDGEMITDPTLIGNVRTDWSPAGVDKFVDFTYMPELPRIERRGRIIEQVEAVLQEPPNFVAKFLEGIKHVKGDEFYSTPLAHIYSLYLECCSTQGLVAHSLEVFKERVEATCNLKYDTALKDFVPTLKKVELDHFDFMLEERELNGI